MARRRIALAGILGTYNNGEYPGAPALRLNAQGNGAAEAALMPLVR